MSKSEAVARMVAPAPGGDFDAIFGAEFGYVMRTLRFLGVPVSDLEDLTHDVFLHVFRHIAEYDPARPARPWLFVFALRTARDFRVRARHRYLSSDELPEVSDQRSLPDAILMRSQAQALALRALETLSEEERAVFVALELDELSAPELSERLEVPLNTVYSRLRRARENFANAARRLALQESYR